MMASCTDITAYVFRADIYCPGCIVLTLLEAADDPEPLTDALYSYRDNDLTPEPGLDVLGPVLDINRYDERTFDSDVFPKVMFRDQVNTDPEAMPAVCGRCFAEVEG